MLPFINHRNTEVEIHLRPLIEERVEDTFLTADVAASATAITVKDIDGFAVDQILLIGELGAEGSEIVKTSASTAPSGTTVTLAAGLEFAHSAGTKIYRIAYDQVEISHSSTLTGSKSVLTTANLQADQKIQVYTDTTQTTGFYFARFKETIGNTFSGYADGVPYGGRATNTVGYMITAAMRDAKVSFSDDLSRQDCYRFITDGITLSQNKLKRFANHQSLDTIIGQTTRGINTVTMPSDIYDDDTLKSIMGMRIGEGENLTPLDPDEFEQAKADTVQTQVRTQASAADTTLEVDNSYDFADTGTVKVYISGTEYSITYTGITRDDATGGTAVLSGIPASGTGSITVTIPVDTNVWQDEEEGEPEYFTVRNGGLEFWPLPDGVYDNKNIYLDYFTVATSVDSDGDTIDFQRFEIIKDYLTWRIRMKVKNNGILDMNDGWYISFKERLNDNIRTTSSVFTHKMMPVLNKVSYKGRGFRRQKKDYNN